MKLLRVGDLGKEKVAALDANNIIRDMSKRFSGSCRKDRSFKKKAKLSFKEKRKLKREKRNK